MPTLLAVFLTVYSLTEVASLWLLWRQRRAAWRHRDEVPAAFRATVSEAEHRRSADYTVARSRFGVVASFVDWATTLALVLGGADALAGLVRTGGAGDDGFVANLAFLALLAVVSAIPGTALSAWRSFGLEARFGFNRTTPRLFLADLGRRALLAVVLGLPLLAALLALMRYVRGSWWLWTWFGAVALMLLAPVVYTRLIAPLFNRFERLADPVLASRVEALLERCGFRSSGLWTMDASRRSSHGNAFFIGWGRSKRIVLFDTLLANRSADEVEAVVAHELGHFRHRHVLFGTIRAAAVLFVVLLLIGFVAREPGLLAGFGFRHGGDAMRLYAANLLVGLALPLLAPFGNALSRRHEYEADDYARREVGAAPMISALVGLTRDSAQTLTPDPLYSAVHHGHPPVPLRVRRLLERERAA